MKRICALMLGLALINPVAAGSEPGQGKDYSVEALSFEQCEVREVIGRLQFVSIERAAGLAEQSMSIIKKIEKLTAKATIPDKPIGQQLSLKESNEFSALSQRLLTVQLMGLMESRRQRDLRLMLLWAQQVDANIRWGVQPQEGTSDYKSWVFFSAARQLLDPHLEITQSEPSCSLHLALARHESEYLNKLASLNLGKANQQLEQLSSKYKMRPLIPERLSPTDRQTYDELFTNVMPQAQSTKAAIFAYETLKVLARGSELLYSWDLQDVIQTAGDANAVGRSANKFASDKKSPETLKIAFGVWRKVNEDMPSDDAKVYRQLSRELQSLDGRKK